MTSLADFAMVYRERGWNVLPIGANKKPAVAWKQYQTTPMPAAALRRAMSRPSVLGIAVIFGATSGGLAARDYDIADAYHEWAQDNSRLAMSLPTAKTPRGYHVYFRIETEQFVKLRDGELRGKRGCYCLLPPSRAERDGPAYKWMIPPAGELPLVDPVEVGFLPDECNRASGMPCSIGSNGSIGSVGSTGSIAWSGEIAATVPQNAGQRNHAIWLLARVLRAAYRSATPAELDPLVREWHRRALPAIETKSFDETRIDFIRAWSRVRVAAGQSNIEKLMQAARTMTPPPEADRYDSDGMRRMATLAAVLQSAMGEGVFFLSCATAGKALEIDPATAWRQLALLKADGLLLEIEQHTRVKATRYRWTGSPARADGGGE